MRVCIIAQQSVSLVGGGPLVQLHETARHLAEHGVDVLYFDQWKRYQRGDFDMAHIFGASFLTYDIANRLKQFGFPFVVSSILYTMRSPSIIRSARRMERSVNKIFSGVWTDYGFAQRVCSLAELTLPNTSDEATVVHEGLGIPRSKIRVIPNGVDERFAHADPRPFIERYGVRDFILNVGHIGSERKNVLALVKALATIDHPAVIIGQIQRGAYADRILSEASRNRNITIIDGLANDSEMLASAYAACRLFALPSLYETPGIAALEAALAGASVVITPHGGTRDYFADDAIYVEPTSVESIRKGIEQGLNAPRSSKLRERIMSQYLWQHVAAKTAEAYREVVHGS